MTEFFTTSDGLRLAYDDRGEGLPLLCLAGLTRNMGDFEPLLGPLAGECRLIRMDYRGRGQSDRDPEVSHYNILREGEDAVELLDHLGLGKAAVLGTSRGGLIAMALGATRIERLSGVILNDSGPVISAQGLARIIDYVGRRPAPLTLDAMAEATAKNMAPGFPGLTAADWRRHVAHWYDERPGGGLDLRYDPGLRDALLAQAQGGALPDLWPFFDALAPLPVAVIRGANSDILSAETFAEMGRRHPGLMRAEVPDRGHVPFLDEPESLALIRTFLTHLRALA